jgi:DNA polymerase I
MDYSNHNISVLATLHPADLFREPRMRLPTLRDWSKVPKFLKGTWPAEWPEIVEATEQDSGKWTETLIRAEDARYVSIDTEYVPESGFMYQLGLYYPQGDVFLWDRNNPSHISVGELKDWLRPLVSKVPVVFQNALADIPVIEQATGIGFRDYNRVDDTLLAHATLWSEWRHNLAFLASIYGSHDKVKHRGPGDYAYLRGDVVDTMAAWEAMQLELERDPLSRQVYEQYMMPLVPILLRAKERGIKVNQEEVHTLANTLKEECDAQVARAHAYCGYPINLDSVLSLSRELDGIEELFTQLKRKARRTSTGRISLTDEIMTELQNKYQLKFGEPHPLIAARLAYIDARQQLSSYITPLVGKERVYPDFKPYAQANGRWSTTNPPLAQLPEHLKTIIMPDDGYVWVEMDWDAIEARIMAYTSDDPVLIEAMENDYDLHTINVCDLFGYDRPSDLVDPHQSLVDTAWREKYSWEGKGDKRRMFAKRFMFSLFYGKDPKNAPTIPNAKKLGLKNAELVSAAQRWLTLHPKISAWQRETKRQAVNTGEVRTFLGRRRKLFTWKHQDRVREAFDFPLQAAVSDIMNATVIGLERLLEEHGHLVYTVHDSIKVAVKEDKFDQFFPSIKAIVERPWSINKHHVGFGATYHIRKR